MAKKRAKNDAKDPNASVSGGRGKIEMGGFDRGGGEGEDLFWFCMSSEGSVMTMHSWFIRYMGCRLVLHFHRI